MKKSVKFKGIELKAGQRFSIGRGTFILARTGYEVFQLVSLAGNRWSDPAVPLKLIPAILKTAGFSLVCSCEAE